MGLYSPIFYGENMKNATGFKGYSAFKAYNKVVFYLRFINHFNYKSINQSALILALKSCDTIEEYQSISEQLTSGAFEAICLSNSEIIKEFKLMSNESKRACLLEALTYCDMSESEVLALVSIKDDANGIPYSKASFNNLSGYEISNLIVDSMIDFSSCDFDFGILNDADFDVLKSGTVSLDDEVADIIAANEKISIGSLLPIAVKRTLYKIREYLAATRGQK
jgi:hypothetical protein